MRETDTGEVCPQTTCDRIDIIGIYLVFVPVPRAFFSWIDMI